MTTVFGEDSNIQFQLFFTGEVVKADYYDPALDGIYFNTTGTEWLIIDNGIVTKKTNDGELRGSIREKWFSDIYITFSDEQKEYYKYEYGKLINRRDETIVFIKSQSQNAQ